MQFLATDRTTIERGIVYRGPYVVISVRDPGTRRPRIVKSAGLRSVLYLAFHDAEPVQGFTLPLSIRLMSPRQARRIAKFAGGFRDQVQGIVCHCEQGMSRSPAIAAAIAHGWGVAVTELVNETQPNPYVYRLVREAMTERAPRRGRSASPSTVT